MKEFATAAEIQDRHNGKKVRLPGEQGLWEVFSSGLQLPNKNPAVSLFKENPSTGRKEFRTIPLQKFQKYLKTRR